MLANVIAPDKTAMLVNMGFLIFRLPYHAPSSHAIGSLKAEKPFSGCLNPIPTMQTKMSKMNFTVKPFPELTTAELHAIYTARVAVFVVEQACSYQEVDAQDLTALHIFAEQNGAVIAYCRLIPHGDSVHLGRVLVLPERRAEKLGRKIVAFAMDYARAHFPQCSVYAQAQTYLHDFYASFGFIAQSESYLEDNIPHMDMLLPAVQS